MFKPGADQAEKLRVAKKKLVFSLEHWAEQFQEMRRVSRFYHNTGGEAQWTKDDVKYMEDTGRTLLTMNMLAQKVQSLVGMQEDNRQRPIIAPVGMEDSPMAEVLNYISDRIRYVGDFDAVDAQVYEGGLVMGECDVQIDVNRDPKNPSEIMIEQILVPATEVSWDQASERKGRGDARFVYWPKWLTEAQFKAEYPDKAERFDELKILAQGDNLDHSVEESIQKRFLDGSGLTDYEDLTGERWFRHRKEDEIRVVHLEYKSLEKQWWATSIDDPSQPEAIEADMAARIKKGKGGGGAFDRLEVFHTFVERVRWLEFIGNDILYDDLSPQPYEGFSLVPFTCYYDWVSGHVYGFLRHLLDPQRELNKSYSMSVDHMSAQAKPGYIAEESAVADRDAFEDQTQSPGATAWVKDGKLTAGAIQPRDVPSFSPASQKRLENSALLLDRISGIITDQDSPSSHAEAAATVQLRHRRMFLSMIQVMKSFQRFQHETHRRIVESIVNAMPDHQMGRVLGNSQRFSVQNGIVTDQERQTQIPLNDVRELEFNIEFDTASLNNTQRLFEVQLLGELKQLGFPVDPVVMVEKAAVSRDVKERLRAFAQQMIQAESEANQQNQQMAIQQLRATIEIEARKVQMMMAKAQEQQRHNLSQEELEAQRNFNDALLRFLDILEQADADEKQFLIAKKTQAESARASQGN